MKTATRDVNRDRMSLAALAFVALALCASQPRAESELRSLDGINLSLKMSDTIVRDAPRATPVSAPLAPRSSSTRDYRIGTEDLLEVQVFGVDQLSRTVRVNSMGFVSLPLIGNIEVGGLTAQEAENEIATRLADAYLQHPQVSLFIKEYTNQRVTIEGAVSKPGIYPLRGQTTLLRSLAMAGGQGSLSDMSEVKLFRLDASGRRESQTYDVERIRRGEAEDPMVVNDDVIVVNRDKARTVLKDSIFRDVIDAINPFSPLVPH
jgi:polysaccharide export outer membrane protein